MLLIINILCFSSLLIPFLIYCLFLFLDFPQYILSYILCLLACGEVFFWETASLPAKKSKVARFRSAKLSSVVCCLLALRSQPPPSESASEHRVLAFAHNFRAVRQPPIPTLRLASMVDLWIVPKLVVASSLLFAPVNQIRTKKKTTKLAALVVFRYKPCGEYFKPLLSKLLLSATKIDRFFKITIPH